MPWKNYNLSFEVICTKSKQTSIREKFIILQSIGIIFIKSKETKMVTYTCRYCSRHLIPIIQSCEDELGIKWPQCKWSPLNCFLTFYNYDPYWLQNYKFFLMLVYSTTILYDNFQCNYSSLLSLQLAIKSPNNYTFWLTFFCIEIESQSHPIIYNTLYEGMAKWLL